MAVEFVCKVGWAGRPSRDFQRLHTWSSTCHCDLTDSGTRVFSTVKHAGTKFGVQDSRGVYLYRSGSLMDCRAWLLHATATQTLVKDIRGTDTPQAGDQWRQIAGDTYGWVTLSDGGNPAIAVAECYNDSPMSDLPRLAGWGTSSVNKLIIRTPSSERHTGVAHTGFRLTSRHPDNLLYLNNVDILIQGIEFEGGGNQITGDYGLEVRTIDVEACLFYDNVWGAMVLPPSSAYLTMNIWNCIFYNSFRTVVAPGHHSGTLRVENCTVFNPGGYGIFRATCYNTVVHKQSNNVSDCFGDECDGDYNCDGSELYGDETAPGAHSLHGKILSQLDFYQTDEDPTTLEVDIDLHVFSTSVLVARGVDRSSGPIGFNTDIDGDLRIGAWTIGADTGAGSGSASCSSLSSSSCSCSSSSCSSSWCCSSVSYSSHSLSSSSSSHSSCSSSSSCCSSSFCSSSSSRSAVAELDLRDYFSPTELRLRDLTIS